jgi:Cu(I)/Ag(I) efflux system membrane fusion protein
MRLPTALGSRTLHRFRGMSPRTRRLTIAGVGALALLGIVWAVVASRDEPKTSSSAARGMESMEGMAGMKMTEGGSVVLTSAQIRQFGITFGIVAVRVLTSEVRTTGVVTFDETKIVQVAPKFGGFVERLYVDFTGQPVTRGQSLLEIYSPELVAAQQELLVAAELQRDIGRSPVPGVPAGSTNLVEAAKRRLRLWDISEGQIEAVLRSGRVRRTMTLYAPASGVVVEKKVVRGQATTAGEQLYTIADLTDLWIDVQLREADAAAVQIGSGADVEFAGLPGRTFKGRVEFVYPTVAQEARTVRARVAVTNSDGVLKPGMYATVRVMTPARSALTVPNAAVIRTGERNIVFVDMGGGELMPHEVQLGPTVGEYTEVLAGVDAGQRVVTSAQFLLDSESNLAEVMRSMMGQTGSGEMKDMPGMQMPGMDDKGASMKGMPGMKMPPPPTPR